MLHTVCEQSWFSGYRYFLWTFTQEETPHILRFYLHYTVMIPAAPQETVGEAGIEPETDNC
jgi:hypothetical protein